MKTGDLLAMLSLVVSIINAAAALYLAYKALSFTARPRLIATVQPPENQRRYRVQEVGVVTIALRTRPYWYADPAATEITVHVNLDAVFDPLRLRFGSNFERVLEQDDVKTGKGMRSRRSQYLEAFGIWLTSVEDEERLELTFAAPRVPGQYMGWVSAFAREGPLGTHPFTITVYDNAEADHASP